MSGRLWRPARPGLELDDPADPAKLSIAKKRFASAMELGFLATSFSPSFPGARTS
jgi:hypothetical protein